MTGAALVVHLGRCPVVDPAPGPDRHVRISRWPRPGPLAGADHMITHGAGALLIGFARARRNGVGLCFEPTGSGVDAWLARILGVAPVDRSGGQVDLPITSGQAARHLRLDDVVHLRPAATRAAGDDLLVAGADPDVPTMELTGTGPRIWLALRSGTSLRDIVDELADTTGASSDEVRGDVLRFAGSLVDAGLAECS